MSQATAIVKDHTTAQITTFDVDGQLTELQVEMDRRFNIFNMVIGQNITYQGNMFKDINMYLKTLSDNYNKLQEDFEFYKWTNNLPIYKKLWYRITNKDLFNIYKQNGN